MDGVSGAFVTQYLLVNAAGVFVVSAEGARIFFVNHGYEPVYVEVSVTKGPVTETVVYYLGPRSYFSKEQSAPSGIGQTRVRIRFFDAGISEIGMPYGPEDVFEPVSGLSYQPKRPEMLPEGATERFMQELVFSRSGVQVP